MRWFAESAASAVLSVVRELELESDKAVAVLGEMKCLQRLK